MVPSVTTTAAGVSSEATSISEEELQFAALQAMSAVLCCGPCFNVHNLLSEDGTVYGWLSTLLASKDEKVIERNYDLIMRQWSADFLNCAVHFGFCKTPYGIILQEFSCALCWNNNFVIKIPFPLE